MLLKGWRTITKAACRPEARTVHCVARLEQDIGEAIPYLNAVLGGYTYVLEPPSLTFRSQGKLISVHADHVAINALHDAEEAEKILQWLQRKINETWERRAEITPSFQAAPQPKAIEILRLLPKTNCGQCGQPTCTVFAALAMKGGKGAEHCPGLSPAAREQLAAYLARFHFSG